MGRTLHNKIRLGRRASLFNMGRLRTAVVFGAVACAGLTLLVATLIQ